jgi:hypothetical protein
VSTSSTEKKLDALIELMARQVGTAPPASAPPAPARPPTDGVPPIFSSFEEEALYGRFKARLIEEVPGLLKVLNRQPTISVTTETYEVEADGASPRGRLARLIASGFMDAPIRPGAILSEFKRTGPESNGKAMSVMLAEFVAMGFLTREGDRYKAVPEMKRNITANRK